MHQRWNGLLLGMIVFVSTASAQSVTVGDNSGGSTSRLYLAGTDTTHYIYSSGTNGNTTYFGEYANGAATGWQFVNTHGGTTVMTVLASGGVGIGTTSPHSS